MTRIPGNSAFERGAPQLQQLSDEVSRIATTLARLAVDPEVEAKTRREKPANDIPERKVAVETVRRVIQARRLRSQFFDGELFADPAWDMLLDLFHAELAQRRVPVSSLCIAAAVPATTALRWISTMTDAGLFRRRADPYDGRRVFIELSPEAGKAMRRYFNEIGKSASA
jgi:DNA-binding MarR family transcriptional regulator